jgi:GTP cyclohydrolase II
LEDLGVQQIQLLTNNPEKEYQLLQHGIKVVEQVPLEVKPNAINKDYLYIKKKKMSHRLSYV